MKQSLRARRMARHHKRSKAQGRLSLVSLMDIFTILVFFLLVNSSDVEVLQTHKSIDLPQSVAEQKPEETLVVTVTDTSILVNGRKVADTEAAMAGEGEQIAGLREELAYLAERRPFRNEQERQKGRDITIMGDKDTPYTLLKKVMATSAETGYRNISLAVTRINGEDGQTGAANLQLDRAPAVEG